MPELTSEIDDLARAHPRALKRAVRPAVARAAAAVAAGARPGAMLDACPGLTPAAAADLAARVARVTGADVVAGALDGCCFVLSRRALGVAPAVPTPPHTPPGALAGGGPWPILFGDDGAPRWGSRHDAAELAAALAAVAAAVAAATPGTAVDLDALLLPPPPLNAWLLGYPVAYDVRDQAGAARAARALSGGGVQLTTLAAELEGRGAAASAATSVPPSLVPIAAFSVPTSLVGVPPPPELGDGWWDQWLESVSRASAVAVAATRTTETGAFTL